MTDIYTYLKDYREEELEWIARYLRGEQITFKDIMATRVGYYPGSGFDGELMKVGNKSHSVHSFLYVDYMLKRKDLEDHLAEEDSILGYHQVGQIEWKESDLMPNGQYPIDFAIRPRHASPNSFVRKEETPYCFSVIMERNEDKDDAWGAAHFVVTFLFADGIATYYQLFAKEYKKAPWLFLLQDHGFGGNYDEFGAGGILDKIIQRNHCFPTFVLCASNTNIWRGYEKLEKVSPIYGGMHQHQRGLYELKQV